jgi:uncharacterized protein with PQ loop repeat
MRYIEILGIIATILILISFASSNKLVIRTVNSIGSVLFVIYGIAIGATSVWLLNGLCIILNIYKIYKETNTDGR